MHSWGNASGVLGRRLAVQWTRGVSRPQGQRRLAHTGDNGYDRLSTMFMPSAKGTDEDKNDAHSLLIRGGFLRQAQAGIFHTLPLGLRVQSKIEALIDKHMRRLDASKLSLSSITGEHLWRKSGRLSGKSELFKVEGQHATTNMLLAPTHEEEITEIIKQTVHSWRQVPLRLYQIGRKYRDERRPRAGLLRSREFLMKDLYTFDIDDAAALETYAAVKAAYIDLFDELKIPYSVAEADSGTMGGNLSHEFHFKSEDGEDTLVTCNNCSYIANEELAERAPPTAYKQDNREFTSTEITSTTFVSRDSHTLVEVYHPSTHDLPKRPKPQINLHALSRIVPDLDFNNISAAFDTWKAAQSKHKRDHGFLPQGKFTLMRLFDRSLLVPSSSSPSSANTTSNTTLSSAAKSALPDTASLKLLEPKTTILDFHLDPTTKTPMDLLRIAPGDTCPRCNHGLLDTTPAIEIAHTFHLGTRYTKPFAAEIQIPHTNNKRSLLQMGCHGIGVSRLIAASASILKDARGLNWPRIIAPWEVCVIPWTYSGKSMDDAPSIATLLSSQPGGECDTILDDRKGDGASKVTDADIVGFPVLVILGRAWMEREECEVQCRRLGVREYVTRDKLVEFVRGLLERL